MIPRRSVTHCGTGRSMTYTWFCIKSGSVFGLRTGNDTISAPSLLFIKVEALTNSTYFFQHRNKNWSTSSLFSTQDYFNFNYALTFTIVGVSPPLLMRYHVRRESLKRLSSIFLIKDVLFLLFLPQLWRALYAPASTYSGRRGSDRISLFNCICMTPCLEAVTVSINYSKGHGCYLEY